MIISKKAIPRRTVLRGMGATLALPLLDSMVPALSALAKTAGKPVNRFGVVYVPNGDDHENYLPAAEGADYELTPTLSALAPFREQMLVVSGLNCVPSPRAAGRCARQGQHAVPDRRVAADQRDLARRRHLDGPDPRQRDRQADAACRRSSWRSNRARPPAPATRLCVRLHEHDFLEEREHAAADAEQPARRVRAPVRRQPAAPIPVRAGADPSRPQHARFGHAKRSRSCRARCRPADRTKLSEYLEAIRDVERRIQMAEAQSDQELPVVEHPAGIPADCEDHMKLMFDLQVLAYQTRPDARHHVHARAASSAA